MIYMGSKLRMAKYILPIILESRKPDQWYVEPFVGGGNMIDKVDGVRYGFDINEYVIEALKLIRDDVESLPKNNIETTEDDYKRMKANEQCLNIGLRGYYGFSLSFGAMFFAGWRRDKKNVYDYVTGAYNSAVKQSPLLQGVHLMT